MTERDPILVEREKTHGDFRKLAQTAQGLKVFLRLRDTGTSMNAAQQEALDLIATKLARIVCGDADFLDHWLDLSGYSRLICDMLEGACKE